MTKQKTPLCSPRVATKTNVIFGLIYSQLDRQLWQNITHLVFQYTQMYQITQKVNHTVSDVNCVLHLYLYKYENVYLSVCLLTFLSAISKPIGIPYGTKFLLDPEWVLKQ